MEKLTLPFSETNHFEKIISDYFSGNPSLNKFYKYNPSLESFDQVINDRKKFPVNRKLLVEELKKQYNSTFADGGDSHDLTRKNIQLLTNENTFTVTTGQQLNILSGPLYYIYKIITAINLAEKLSKKFPGNNFVPVFWMASEDHDYEEIKSVLVFGKRITWNTNQSGAVGRFKPEGFEEVLKQAEEILGSNSKASEVTELAKKVFSNSATLSEATRKFLHSLFSKYGLVVIDGDSKELKKEMIPFFEKEIKENISFKNVSQTNSEMQIEYGLQVHPREINLFYLQGNSRNRISVENNEFKVAGTDLSFSKDKMLAEIKNNPERISPNVILRPMYQEVILPNLAYLGGPAEVHYWMQFKSSFDAYGVFYPMILLRNCVMLLNGDAVKKIKKLTLEVPDIFLFTDQLIKKYISKNGDSEISFDRASSTGEKMFEEIATKVSLVDVTLKQSVEAEKAKFFNSLKAIQAKVIKAQKLKDEQNVNQVSKLKDKYFPGGSLQEREENILQYISQYGISFIEELKNNLEPLPKEFLVLEI